MVSCIDKDCPVNNCRKFWAIMERMTPLDGAALISRV